MKVPTKTNNKGFSEITTITLVFIILKLTHQIGWSWWWILSPIWIALGLIVLIVGIVVLIEVIRS